MSTHVIGFRAPDEKWRAMKAAWDSCKAAGVAPPSEVARFFDEREPDTLGIEVRDLALTPWCDDCRDGFELEIAKLPPNVTHLRFYNSY